MGKETWIRETQITYLPFVRYQNCRLVSAAHLREGFHWDKRSVYQSWGLWWPLDRSIPVRLRHVEGNEGGWKETKIGTCFYIDKKKEWEREYLKGRKYNRPVGTASGTSSSSNTWILWYAEPKNSAESESAQVENGKAATPMLVAQL